MKLSRDKLQEQKGENIAVVVAMAAITVFIFIFFGWSSIKSFLTTPLIWKGQDSLTVTYLGTLSDDGSDENYNIYLGIANHTDETIVDYNILFNIEGVEFEYKDFYNDDISAYGLSEVELPITISEWTSMGETRVSEKVLNKLTDYEHTDDVDFSYRIKTLKSSEKTIVNNTGLWKDILIIAVSIFLGAIGFFGSMDRQWLRILCKLFALPAVIVIILVVLVYLGASYAERPEVKAAAEESRRKDEERKKAAAARKYKGAAQTKAACIARGDYKGAAYAQEQMDKSAIDMISGDGANKAAYKSAAHTKAASVARGDYKGAARAQAEMDKKLVDILKDN